jgi:putative spermidine/putrescine transport system permease protein
VNGRRLAIMLAPAMLVIGGLFAGGLGLAFAQSVGYFAPLSAEDGFTLAHYRALVVDEELRAALALTFWIATATTAISASLGMGLAIALREAAARSRVVGLLLQVPLAVPHLAMAVALVHLVAPSGLVARAGFALGLVDAPASFPVLVNDRYGIGVVLAFALKEIPFVAVMTLSLLARVGDEHEAVARTLGATAWQRLRYVTVPLVAPAVVSASLVVFAFVFGAFETPFLLGRTYPAALAVVAQQRFMSVDLANRPDAIAVAVTISAIATVLVYLYLRLARALVGVERPALF